MTSEAPSALTSRKTRNKSMEVRKPFSVPELWPGCTVYIIGGGPSLSQMNLELIHSKRVIGVNQAFRLGPWIDVLYFGDCNFYDQNIRKGLQDYAGLMISSCQRIPEQGWPGVHRVKRSKPYGINVDKRNAISWNNNSGASAINIAYWLGAKRVVLLGFDMHKEGDSHHWHSYYRDRGPKFDPYHRHLIGWPKIAEDAKSAGLEIINATPDSTITEFPFLSLEEVV